MPSETVGSVGRMYMSQHPADPFWEREPHFRSGQPDALRRLVGASPLPVSVRPDEAAAVRGHFAGLGFAADDLPVRFRTD